MQPFDTAVRRFLKGSAVIGGGFATVLAMALGIGWAFQKTIIAAALGLLMYVLIFLFPFVCIGYVVIFLAHALLTSPTPPPRHEKK